MKSLVFVPRSIQRAIVALLASQACVGSMMAQDSPAESEQLAVLERSYRPDVLPLLQKYCFDCHSADLTESNVDLGLFPTWAEVRKHSATWQKLGEMLETGQMPPVDSPQLSDDERTKLREWVRALLAIEAKKHDGDPGRVVLRRLSNSEYTYTIRDLTGVDDLDPAREFPVDGAAGEGFTNTGAALVISPTLLTKYMEAAQDVSQHVVLTPDGIRFSPYTTRSDWTNETLAKIRQLYSAATASGGGETVNLQGIVFNTNEGGLLPLKQYLAATLAEREALTTGGKSLEAVAEQYALSPKYLQLLWSMLNATSSPDRPSLLLDRLREQWRDAQSTDGEVLAADVARWQQALWTFNPVGHIGKVGGPEAWMERSNPLTDRRQLRLKLPTDTDAEEIVVYLAAGDAGDGNDHDFVVWERPRLVAPGRPDLLLRDVHNISARLRDSRQQLYATAASCLAAAADARSTEVDVNVDSLAGKHGVPATFLAAWLDYLGVGLAGRVPLGEPFQNRAESVSGYDFVRGWVGENALSIVANSSDNHVRIPGNMPPHSIAVHPAPTRSVSVGWLSPLAKTLTIDGFVQHAHPECGNGVAWYVELRRGKTRQRLAEGISHGPARVAFGPLEQIKAEKGDIVSLTISPRGDHSCDLTSIDLNIRQADRRWSLADDVSPDILAGNPRADSHGRPDAWHFFSESVDEASGYVIPSGSLLAKWQSSGDAREQADLANQIQGLLQKGPHALPKDSPDAALHQSLNSLRGPLLSAALQDAAAKPIIGEGESDSRIGLDPDLFGKHPTGLPVDADSLCVQAPTLMEARLPAALVAGAEFVVDGALHSAAGEHGSVQLQVSTERPESLQGTQASTAQPTDEGGLWTSNLRGVDHSNPVVVKNNSAARRRFETSFEDFRQLFPAALCYTKIVPVDEVVTLTLYYRQDEALQRLVLGDEQIAELDRLWDELHFVSRDALTLVDALAQILEYATQDADPKVFEPLVKPTQDRADAFGQRLIDTESVHLEALVDFAASAYRRPLADDEGQQLRQLYASIRAQEIPHDEAIRLTLSRILLAPSFLYRIERPASGSGQSPISDHELANRLSYFLWSSLPDDELRELADAGLLNDPDVIRAQTRRMLGDAKSRRLAIEFACQWLQIRDFDELDEKSERHFPTFADIRSAMYEEAIQFFSDLFQNDRSVLDILDADHAFLNQGLAEHYGIPGVEGPDWRRVDGVRRYERGGALTFAATLAKQSGASRTSPILRGNWISEVILGEKLPRPPKDVPTLDDVAPEGLTERQLIEMHSSDPACAKCHVRIDPFGFAMENYDAIGRFRDKDGGGLAIDSRTTLPDGQDLAGINGLRQYLLTARGDAFLHQFCRKLLGYALGRSVQLGDALLLTEMKQRLQANDYRFSSAVESIVLSRQFRQIRGRDWAADD